MLALCLMSYVLCLASTFFSKLLCPIYFLIPSLSHSVTFFFYSFLWKVCFSRLSCPSLHEYGRAQTLFPNWPKNCSPEWEEIPKEWGCFCHQWPTSLLPLPTTHPFPNPCSPFSPPPKLPRDSGSILTWSVSGCKRKTNKQTGSQPRTAWADLSNKGIEMDSSNHSR